MKLDKKSLLNRFSKINVEAIEDEGLRAKARKLKAKQGGFTLLELLVVVAILAAIAGTATIALQDTDARASAAAHVAMMDELNKGIHTFRVLNRNTQPSRFDSLLTVPTGAGNVAALADADVVTPTGFVANAGFDPADGLAVDTFSADIMDSLRDAGMDQFRYINVDLTGVDGEVTGVEDCANLPALVASRNNAVVAGNVFMSPAANGCGSNYTIPAAAPAAGMNVAVWTGGTERLTGQQDPAGAGSAFGADTNIAYLAVGIGPSSNLFDTNNLGGMTTVPVYRHVAQTEYNRYIAIFNVGTYDATNGGADGIVPAAQPTLTAIVDGALDTKEEELGEWDGTRNTI